MIDFNKKIVLDDYNKLLNMYLNCTDETSKAYLYKQLQFMYYVDKKLAKQKLNDITMPSEYKKISVEEKKQEKSFFDEIDDLTCEICYNLRTAIPEFKSVVVSSMLNRKITFYEYRKELSTFFEESIPDDIKLVNDTFAAGRIMLDRKILHQEASIVYLENIMNYYIKIGYNRNLKLSDVRNTVHEFGHASVYMTCGRYQSKEKLLTEVMAMIYELLYLNKYTNSNMIVKEKEYGYLLNTSGLSHLILYYCGDTKRRSTKYISYIDYLELIKLLYGIIISITLIANNNDRELLTKMNYIKANFSYMSDFDILKNVGVDTDSLLYTSQNLKKLILHR